jgi:hypothetical protein
MCSMYHTSKISKIVLIKSDVLYKLNYKAYLILTNTRRVMLTVENEANLLINATFTI